MPIIWNSWKKAFPIRKWRRHMNEIGAGYANYWSPIRSLIAKMDILPKPEPECLMNKPILFEGRLGSIYIAQEAIGSGGMPKQAAIQINSLIRFERSFSMFKKNVSAFSGIAFICCSMLYIIMPQPLTIFFYCVVGMIFLVSLLFFWGTRIGV